MAKRIQRSTPKAAPREAPRASSAGGPAPRRGRSGRVNSATVTEFTIQLATLSEAGIPVVRALTILEGQTRPGPFKEVLREITEDVSGGSPLSEAMQKHDRVFDRLYASMVRAGEAGGVLDRVLQRLAVFREKAAEVRGKIGTAMIYPTVLVLVAVGVVSAVMAFVIPKFKEIFDSFGVDLPEVTQILLNVSTFIRDRWYIVFGLPALLLVLHLGLLAKRQGYRRFFHAFLLRVPVLGGVLRKTIIAGFSRTFGTLIQAGVPHLDALGIVRDTTGNEVLRDAVEDIRRTVREGEGIARPMGETGVFDDIVVNMVDVGEETGELDNMLLKVAEAYEKQVDRGTTRLLNLLEPLMIVAMAVVVGFIVIALFLPLLDIMGAIGST
ncbi:MAG: type II secretion system F family protein [Planctomycetota bacterium]